MNYNVDDRGFYGEFGGAYIPELMYPNIKELRDNYIEIIRSEDFRKEFSSLLKDYAGRPSPLCYASRLSEFYGTRIYLKREDLNHTGAHKINNTIGQILIAKKLGKTRIIAETGAGQHGVAAATVCALMGLKCIVYMGKTDVERQMPNVLRMKMLGALVVPVTSGNMTLKDATNEAIRDWISNPDDTYYLIGSVVGPHPYPDLVTRLQSVISEEYGLATKGTNRENRAGMYYRMCWWWKQRGRIFLSFSRQKRCKADSCRSSWKRNRKRRIGGYNCKRIGRCHPWQQNNSHAK